MTTQSLPKLTPLLRDLATYTPLTPYIMIPTDTDALRVVRLWTLLIGAEENLYQWYCTYRSLLILERHHQL